MEKQRGLCCNAENKRLKISISFFGLEIVRKLTARVAEERYSKQYFSSYICVKLSWTYLRKIFMDHML